MLVIDKTKVICYDKKIPYDLRSDLNVKCVREVDDSILNLSLSMADNFDMYELGVSVLEMNIFHTYLTDDEIYVEDVDGVVSFPTALKKEDNFFNIREAIADGIEINDETELHLIYDDSKSSTRNKICLLIVNKKCIDNMSNRDSLYKNLKNKSVKDKDWVHLFLTRG